MFDFFLLQMIMRYVQLQISLEHLRTEQWSPKSQQVMQHYSLYRSWRLNLEKMDNNGRYSRAIQIQKGTGKCKHNRQYICSVLVFCWQQANLYILDVAPPPHPHPRQPPAVTSAAWALSRPCTWTHCSATYNDNVSLLEHYKKSLNPWQILRDIYI